MKKELSKFDLVVIAEIKANIAAIATMGDGSLPFLVGILASKFKLVFTNESGLVRGRLLKSTLLHLRDLNLLKIQHTNRFPYGSGIIALV
jgi:hypothetical protein